MKLPFLFNNSKTDTISSSWPWPSCNQTRTLSFRADSGGIFKTINSAYLDSDTAPPPGSSEEDAAGGEMTETMIRGLRSERLFFEPGETNSILDQEVKSVVDETASFKESVAMSVDSRDPYADFRRSMAEMVAAHGIKEWKSLEELLRCYLRVNGKHNHEYIVGAFVDLLVNLAPDDNATDINCASSSTSSSRDSPASPLSFCTSSESSSSSSSSTTVTPCVSSSLQVHHKEIQEEDSSDVEFFRS